MKNYSLTMSGILVSVVGTAIMQLGFSESCTNELVQNVPLILGSALAWVGRVKAGGVTVGGFK